MIYFIACPEASAAKIGFCTNAYYLFSRFSTIRSSTPLPVEIVGAEEGGLTEEIALHHRFAGARMHGEWFRLTDEIKAHIAQLSIPVKPYGTRKVAA